jgi:hypothetical protein
MQAHIFPRRGLRDGNNGRSGPFHLRLLYGLMAPPSSTSREALNCEPEVDLTQLREAPNMGVNLA